MPRQSGPPDDYVDVAHRIVEFREKFPDGALQPADPAQPFRVQDVGGKTFIVVVAAAYRSPDDPRPGIGQAWEPFPGPTPFTRDSELQNAETAAWGRAIVAALAADTKKGVASANEVRNRQATDKAEQSPDISDVDDAIRKAIDAGVTIDFGEVRTYALKSPANAAKALQRLDALMKEAA